MIFVHEILLSNPLFFNVGEGGFLYVMPSFLNKIQFSLIWWLKIRLSSSKTISFTFSENLKKKCYKNFTENKKRVECATR